MGDVTETAGNTAGIVADNREERLRSLAACVSGSERTEKAGINLHVHTNESFSFFSSVSEAVLYAFRENVGYFGINDHYTIDGHDEFAAACRIASITPTFSIEAVAMDEDAFLNERRYNDPKNPGKIYLVGKGVTKKLREGSEGHRLLGSMCTFIRKRNRKIAGCLKEYTARKGIALDFSYDDADKLSPRGNTTERHVVQAFCMKMKEAFPTVKRRLDAFSRLLGTGIDESALDDEELLLDTVRTRLVKKGMVCYVEEDGDAFITPERLISLYREFGAVPTYPLMGNPVTEEEEDLEAMIRKTRAYGLYALGILDYRTRVKRAGEIIEAASHYGYPVFTGTEHNTKKRMPLIGPVAATASYYDYFLKSTHFVNGHQRMARILDFGFLDHDGKPRFEQKEGFDFYAHAGAQELTEEEEDDLRTQPRKKIRAYFGL